MQNFTANRNVYLRAAKQATESLVHPKLLFEQDPSVCEFVCVCVRTVQWVHLRKPVGQTVRGRELKFSQHLGDIVAQCTDMVSGQRG